MKKTLKNNKFVIDTRRSSCCNSEVCDTYAYYNTTMKTNDGKDIPMIPMCIKCGWACSIKLF